MNTFKLKPFMVFTGKNNENIKNTLNTLKDYDIIIENLGGNLHPEYQVEYLYSLVKLFNETHNNIKIAFSTHSPYILSALNCCLIAYEAYTKKNFKETAEIFDNTKWISIDRLGVYNITGNEVKSIIDTETNLILADVIDSVSEKIGEIFDELLDLSYKE